MHITMRARIYDYYAFILTMFQIIEFSREKDGKMGIDQTELIS